VLKELNLDELVECDSQGTKYISRDRVSEQIALHFNMCQVKSQLLGQQVKGRHGKAALKK